jgi:endoglucanase
VTGQTVLTRRLKSAKTPGWGTFSHYYELDFSNINQAGRYYLELDGTRSATFEIGLNNYASPRKDLLTFMRQQRCGYNPTLDLVCHQRDGRTMFGPMPDSTFIDASGGWHDAGDQLKYLITSSYATAHMLLSYEWYPDQFEDEFNALGQPGANGIPDVLDEAKWGLDWIHKLHPAPDQLFHQIADDRDHIGWKMPDDDPSDYGWGPNSYRVVYFATGEPQGLREYKSKATGISNLAGRSAAAMALGARIFEPYDRAYAEKCLGAARTLYQLGREKEGFQQGNSYGAPYRYTEDTWADDMEWGAAELYKTTKEKQYLSQARKYALQAATTSWMPLDTADHYRYYPFINLGHFALHEVSESSFQDTLAKFYQEGIEATLARGKKNPFRIGVPFIWCSNNLASALITQIILYEKMTGDRQYHDFMLAQRDWLFGRNPWGTSMFTGIPRDGEYPEDVHTSVYVVPDRKRHFFPFSAYAVLPILGRQPHVM